MADPDTLVYAHIGDLHLTHEGEENHRDLLAIVGAIAALSPGAFALSTRRDLPC